eukprot:3724239-Pleurochrysis_carterae.AAC.2
MQRQPCSIHQRSVAAAFRIPSSQVCRALCLRLEWGNCQHSHRPTRNVAGRQLYHRDAKGDQRRAQAHGSTWKADRAAAVVAEQGAQRRRWSTRVL